MKCWMIGLAGCTVALLVMMPGIFAQEVGPLPRAEDGDRVARPDQHRPTIKDAYEDYFLIGMAADTPKRNLAS